MTIANIEISNFVRGLITEASLLSFPQGASLDELNMKLLNDGTRERRLGLNRELNGVTHDTGLTDEDLRDLRVSYHDWPMPNNNPRLHIGAIQIGAKMWFIDVTKPNPSAHLLNGGASIAADVVGDVAVTSTYINGNLLLTSVSFGTPVLLLYNEQTDTVSSVSTPILIRDLSGVDDGLAIDQRPNTLSSEHLYNLRNQGWSDDIVVASIAEEQHIGFPEGVGASSGNITVGGIVVAVISSDTAWDVATKIAAAINNQIPDNATFPIRADANGTNVLRIFYDKRDGNVAQIAVVDAGALLAAVPISNTAVHGVDNSAVTAITAVFTKLGVYPSNSDLVQLGMVPDLTDPDIHSFDPDVWYQNSHLSTGEAPKGHYIIDAFNRKASREAVSGISPLVSDIELGRLGICTTYAGRVFYGGVLSRISNADSRSRNASGTLYFGQIGASLNTLVNAYQQFDPTNKDLNELLPTDGGTIEITGCSVQTRMISSEGSLFVFTERGIWEIKGGENGFTATEFSVNKISNVGVISPYSIVEINGVFMFWAREGIYRLARGQTASGTTGRWESLSMTLPTIQTMYNSITDEAKRHVKGYFDLSKHQVRWMYHSSGAKVVGSHDVPPPEVSELTLEPGDTVSSTPLGRNHDMTGFSSTRVIDYYKLDVSPFTPSYRLLGIDGETVSVLEQGDGPATAGPFIAHHSVRISDTKMLIVYKGSSDTRAKAVVATLASDAITFGTPVELESADLYRAEFLRRPDIGKLEEGKFLIIGQNRSTNRVFSQIVEVDGFDTITPDSMVDSTIDTATISQQDLVILSSTRAILTTPVSVAAILPIEISGTTVTFNSAINLTTVKPWDPPWDTTNQFVSSVYTPVKLPGVERARVMVKIQLGDGVDLVFREGWFDIDSSFTISGVLEFEHTPALTLSATTHTLSAPTASVNIGYYTVTDGSGDRDLYAMIRQSNSRLAQTLILPSIALENVTETRIVKLDDTRSLCRYNRTVRISGVALANTYFVLRLV